MKRIYSYEKLVTENGLRVLEDLARERRVPLYVVGGAVRDLLLCREGFRDVDVALGGDWSGLPEDFARRCGGTFFWLDEERRQGRVVLRGSEGMRIYDFSPLRGDSLEEDLASRDFTVNAMALVPTTGGYHLADPQGGARDLETGIIRAPSPRVLDDDPLRLLRAFRFAAILGFSIDRQTFSWISERGELLRHPAPERVRDEFFRLLSAPAAAPVLGKMEEARLLRLVLPSLKEEEEEEAAAGLRRVEEMEEIAAGLPLLFPDEEAELRSYLSTESEADVTIATLVKFAALLPGEDRQIAEGKRLRLGGKSLSFLRRLGKAEQNIARSLHCGDRAFFRFFRDSQPAGAAAIVKALAETVDRKEALARARELLHFRHTRYDAAAPDLLLDGPEVMEILGIGPGPAVGGALEELKKAEAAGIVTNADEAREFLAKNVLTTRSRMG
jgi:poly(A) polymerase